ncbi:calcium permeable stress-gated cation channel 1-like isoform X2 [Gigantopelta aegis]|uniref:calcium permeable stress-gated cation channel 1-like isoform X2 n=1 Tax=Gigantopelta aegis TaxID=1735272 RepID=UPI001B88CFFF|nr:calcium permeable stress-gated cation channel 1-like isoform X2 [Gigantopelta aegis]
MSSCSPHNKTFTSFTADYAGIPDNLIINIIIWVVLLLLFTFLRKLAWDYGRIALISRTEEKWTSLFFGEHDNRSMVGSQESLDTTIHSQDKGFFSWIIAFIRVKDVDILHKCGRDAIQYLSFQRYLLVYLLVICILSVSVILPVNFQGNIIGNETDFGHTTIGNVNSDSPLLWVHASFAIIYLLLAVFMLRHFSSRLKYDDEEQVSRTLMIANIAKDKCYVSILKQHFREAYPEVVIIDVQFAYNISDLIKMDYSRRVASEAKLYSEAELKKTSQRPMMRPHMCGQLCCCAEVCGSNQVDAIDFYTEEERVMLTKCEDEKVKAYQDPLGIMFITFQQDHMAEKIHMDFRANCKGTHNPQNSSVYWELGVQDWDVKFAPSPENIYWENLSLQPWKWWLRAFIINGLLIVLLFFLTTPSIILSQLDKIQYTKAIEDLHSPILVQFVPTVLLLLFATLLPTLVYYSDQYIGHWTKTAEHHAVMRKTFIFLLLMVVILPSLGLTSARALFELAVVDKNQTMQWECIFLSGNGAFFVNYVVTAAFIGTALELIRFSELFMYALRLSLARSSAEKSTVRKLVLWDFQFGCQYAWMLCIFAVITAYSLICPLVTPFGLVYLALKHVVDRYNIFFAYNPSKIDEHIHRSAINFVVIDVILAQVNIVFFTGLRAGYSSPVFLFSCVALFVSLLVFVGRISFGWFRHLNPIRYRHFATDTDDDNTGEGLTKPFVANVLVDQSKPDQNGSEGMQQSYGSINQAGPVPEYSLNSYVEDGS